MKSKVKDTVASVRDRLAAKAKLRGIPFQEILEHYAISGFLYRLSISRHSNLFVLKGGLAFLGWGLKLRRPTRDIDLQANTSNTAENLTRIVTEICEQSVLSDPLTFDTSTIKTIPIILQMENAGVRIKLVANLGNIQIPLQVDFSFANVITPGPILMQYPTPLGDTVAEIQGYPPETAIAEKVEAMVSLGKANGRLKDFFDIWLLSQERAFEGSLLIQAIKATFNNRNTSIPSEPPISLSHEFAQAQQKQWTAFLRKFGSAAGAELNDLSVIITQLRDFLLPVLAAAANNEPFNKSWSPKDQWI